MDATVKQKAQLQDKKKQFTTLSTFEYTGTVTSMNYLHIPVV